MQPALLAKRVPDAKRRMHHHHEDDAEALGVVDPVDPLLCCVNCTHWTLLFPIDFVSYTQERVSLFFTDSPIEPGTLLSAP